MDALCAAQGDRLVVILGGVTTPTRRPTPSSGSSATGRSWSARRPTTSPRPTSPPAPRCPALRAAVGWPDAPRPVASDDLLPERVLAGDGHARRHLVEEVFVPLRRRPGDTLIETLTAYFQHGQSLEATARALFVHPNTVRYRLRQVAELTGLLADRRRATRSPCSWRWCSAARRRPSTSPSGPRSL